ncbi:MAG: hypothetical protein R2845_12265 [Thermomicrobiales bacterium]
MPELVNTDPTALYNYFLELYAFGMQDAANRLISDDGHTTLIPVTMLV